MPSSEELPRWSLQDLLAGPPDQAADDMIGRLHAAVAAFEADRPALSQATPPAAFSAILQRYQAISEISARLNAYAFLWYVEDTQNQAALALRSRLQQTLTESHNRTLFFGLWFKSLPDEVAARLIAAAGDLRYYLESLRRFKPYTLSEPEEKLINLKDVNGIDALVKVYEMITNRFAFRMEIDGKTTSVTRDQLASYFRHTSPDVRAAAFRELWRVYGENTSVLSQIYVHRVRDWRSEAIDLRGYSRPMSFRNLANNLPDSIVDTLLDVCRQNAGVFQRYFKLKARRLGMARLRRYDIYAPFAHAEKTYAYADAIEMVLQSFASFSPEIAGHVRSVIEAGHLDAQPRPGKRGGGAFCYGVLPGVAPWVLANYSGQVHDVATLAHELGHAAHALLAGGHSLLTFSAPLPLAETASVFSEMLLTGRLLKEEQDPAVRVDLLAHAIDDAYVTVMRQAFFTLFERDAHEMIGEGRTFDDVCTRYLENLHEQFGDALDVADEFKLEWTSIPHFYNTPFYTYAYSFGQLLVLALYQQYRAEGDAFIPRFTTILSAGGSAAPVKILEQAGLDISSPAFWQGGFSVIQGLIDELEQLVV